MVFQELRRWRRAFRILFQKYFLLSASIYLKCSKFPTSAATDCASELKNQFQSIIVSP